MIKTECVYTLEELDKFIEWIRARGYVYSCDFCPGWVNEHDIDCWVVTWEER